VSLITERRLFPPWGLEGGGPGAVGENWLLRRGDEDFAERLGDKCTVELKAGDVLRMLTPGGGGFGSGAGDDPVEVEQVEGDEVPAVGLAAVDEATEEPADDR
jgi:N-methylhydantoinase B/oxoprolinase/acetone carboxylase alpha subunit